MIFGKKVFIPKFQHRLTLLYLDFANTKTIHPYSKHIESGRYKKFFFFLNNYMKLLLFGKKKISDKREKIIFGK